jgi:uncharacterized protein (DUF983 family)
MQERPRNAFHGSPPPRPVGTALLRGATLKCPACGVGAMFRRYLKVADHCPRCGEALHHQRADDAPPYFTILLVGHLVIAPMLAFPFIWRWSVWHVLALTMPVLAGMTLLVLPLVKGAVIGAHWAVEPRAAEDVEPV